MRQYILALAVASLLGPLTAYTTAEALSIDVTSGTGGSYLPNQSFNETRGVDVTVLTSSDLVVSSLTLNALNVGGDGMATVGARIYSSPSGVLLASNGTTVFANGAVTVPISTTLHAGQSYRVCFYCGPPGPHADNSATLFEPGSFPYTEGSGSLRINQAYESPTDSYPTNFNIFDPWIVIQATPTLSGVADRAPAQSLSLVYPAAPSPFVDRTTIRFDLAQAAPVEANVVTASGRMIRVLMRSAAEPAGQHALVWDGRDDQGRRAVAGIYFVRVRAGGRESVQQIPLLR